MKPYCLKLLMMPCLNRITSYNVCYTKLLRLVISDMAPNMSGNAAIDQPAAMYLVELALDLAREVLRPGGQFLVKIFQGEGFDTYLKAMRESFASVSTRKPDASRARSREVYLLGKA